MKSEETNNPIQVYQRGSMSSSTPAIPEIEASEQRPPVLKETASLQEEEKNLFGRRF